MELKKNHLFSMQAELIRQMQVADGLEPCYDTSAVEHCHNAECCWRYDCYYEGAEKNPVRDKSPRNFYQARG